MVQGAKAWLEQRWFSPSTDREVVMKDFVLQRKYSLSPELFFKVFFEDQKFTKEFHIWRGDKDVDISDWYKEGSSSGAKKRICFYTIKVSASELGIAEATKCLESQVYSLDPENKKFVIKCKLTPEISNDLRIDSEWTLCPSAEEPSACDLTVRCEVECLSKVWGVTGMVESMLYDLIHAMHTGFFDLSKQCADDVRQRFERTAKEAAARRMRAINRLTSSLSASSGRAFQSQFTNMKLICGLEKVSAVVRTDDTLLLHTICVPGAIDFVWLEKILRTKLWSLNAANEKGQSLLHVAVSSLPKFSIAHEPAALTREQTKITLLLLELGASVTTVDSNKQTPLHFAASEKSFAALACLLTNPKITTALLNQPDYANKSVLDYLTKEEHPELYQQLVKSGAVTTNHE